MSGQPVQILLIEDNPGDALLIREMLSEFPGAPFALETAGRLSEGLARLEAGGVAVVLLDLSLPDSQGWESFVKLHAQAPGVPIIVLTGHDDEALALETVQAGAQDYLVKGQVTSQALGRAIRYALERKRAEHRLRESEARFRLLYESAPLGYQSLDEHGCFLDVNRAWLDLLGYAKKEEVVGRWFGDFLTPDSAEQQLRNFRRFKESGEIYGAELEMVRQDGSTFLVSIDGKVAHDEQGGFRQTHCIMHDVTERKRAEAALRESETSYRTLSENLPGLVYRVLLRDKGRMLFFNNMVEAMTGYSAQELTAGEVCSLDPLILPEDREYVINSVKRAVRDAHPFQVEYRLRRKDGSVRYFLERGRPVRGEDGQPSYIDGVILDITKRKRAEEALRRERDNLINILDAMEDAVHILGGDYVLQYGNPALVREFGPYEGRRCYEYFHGRQAPCPSCDLSKILGGETLKREWSAPKTGHTYDLLDTPVRNPDGSVAKLGIAHDITERVRAEEALRESEERYRELVEDAADMVWSLDEQGLLTYMNPAGERALGYPVSDIVGRHFTELLAPEERERVAGLFEETLAGREMRQHEITLLSATGARLQYSVNAKAILGPDGRPVGVRGTARDITEQRRLQEHLSRSEKLSALGQMAAGIAHDFNNALTSILSLTQGLLLDTPPGEPRESLSIIEQAARDAALIVRRLQEFAGLKRGREDFALCDLNALAADALELTRPLWKHQIEARQATIEVDLDLGEVSAVRGNPAELREVLTNLIFNAVEAMPGGGRLTLSSYAMPGGQVVLAVSDTGPGIDDEVAGRVFDPFFTTKGPGSSGLGLSMAYGIITRHGGEISVESLPGEGTTFTLSLPPAPAAADPPQPSAVPEEAARKLRVLLVDDDAGVLAGTRKLLWRLGHSVVCAASGEEALRLFAPGQFDLVVTDLGMPGLSGWNVATQIMRLAPGTPVGLLTGWSETVDPETAQRLGIRFVLAKPFDRLELEECLRRACASPAA